jgi:hypothetical protein
MRYTMLALLISGCGGMGGLSASESALVNDSEEIDGAEEAVVTGIEEPLSGSDASDPGALDPATSPTDHMERVRTNPGAWFKPAGCIVTTIDGTTATSVFTNCTGPLGRHTFNGTVISTWSFAPGMLTVTHQSTGFHIDRATVDHQATIVFTKTGSFYTRHRAGSTTGTTDAGDAINHVFDQGMTWDSAAKCITRDGTSSGTLGGRAFSLSIDGYERCGIGSWGCPKSGTITLTRTQPAPQLSLSLHFPGGAKVEVTKPNGTTVERGLLCNANF